MWHPNGKTRMAGCMSLNTRTCRMHCRVCVRAHQQMRVRGHAWLCVMAVHVYLCMLNTHTHLSCAVECVYVHSPPAHACVCACVRVCACVSVCVSVRAHHQHMCVYAYVCMHACLCLCVSVHAYMRKHCSLAPECESMHALVAPTHSPSPTLSCLSKQCTQTARSASPSCTTLVMIPWATSLRLSAGPLCTR